MHHICVEEVSRCRENFAQEDMHQPRTGLWYSGKSWKFAVFMPVGGLARNSRSVSMENVCYKSFVCLEINLTAQTFPFIPTSQKYNNLNIVQLDPELWLKVPRPFYSAVIEIK